MCQVILESILMKIDTISNPDSFVNKRVKELFVAQSERPAILKDISLTRLSPFQRALLVADGTVTRFIESYLLTPIQVILLYQGRRKLHNQHNWLEMPTGGNIIAREVVLQTPSTENQTPKIHAYAVSQIVHERLSQPVVDGLDAGINGIGVLLHHSQLETRRDLLWWGVERVTGLPSTIAYYEGTPFLSRTYRVVADSKPLMLITEKFPLEKS